jgi:putative CRISPR-associated protein (TIGR02619 family)
MFKSKKIKTLAVTVGTSMFLNLSHIDTDRQPEYTELKKTFSQLSTAQDKQQQCILDRIAEHLFDISPDQRIMGAEISSVHAMQEKNFLDEDRQRLILFRSDTPKGEQIGIILKKYFSSDKCPIKFEACELIKISGLQDEKPEDFKTIGLTNLVREMGKHYEKWKNSDFGINATGGYKAQIALASAFGQVMQVCVFYKHEFFDQIIQFPQVPFTIDLEPIHKYREFWADLAEPDAVYEWEELEKFSLPPDVFQSISPLLEEVEIDGRKFFSLSALGQIYWQKYLSSHPEVSIAIPDAGQTERKKCTFGKGHHLPANFEKYVEKVYRDNPFITSCHSLPHEGQQGIKHGLFIENSEGKITGNFISDYGGRFEILTSKRKLNELEKRWVLNKLNDWSRKN